MTIFPKILAKFLVLFDAKVKIIALWDCDPAATILISVHVDLSKEHGRRLARLLAGVTT